MLKKLLVAALLVGASAPGALAQRATPWTILGSRDAGGADQRIIDVGGRVAGSFHVLSLEASKGVPTIRRVVIQFGDNSRQVVELGSRKIDRSNPRIMIPLQGGARYIDSITIALDRDSYGEVLVSGE